jgi:2,4-dienoyl-CoA reductase (NADPH2)
MQRKSDSVGKNLGKTTGWTHRLTLQRRGVKMINGVEYQRIDDQGLHVLIGGQPSVMDVDTVIICAGQLPLRTLYDQLQSEGIKADLIGGAYEAAELDAKAAIQQASLLAAAI